MFGSFCLFAMCVMWCDVVCFLSCTNIDEDDVAEGDDWFLRADYSVSCETTRYSIAVIVASIAVVLYPSTYDEYFVTERVCH